MKRVVAFFSCALIFILAIASCKHKNNNNMKEYIEQGFAKPVIQEASPFTVQNEGDFGKIYVPSEEDVEVEFAIKNKFEQELMGVAEVSQGAKSLFNKEPIVKKLTKTHMVVSFNFKKDAEPSSVNSFLGENVPINVIIREKSTGRTLSQRSFSATCNPPPLQYKKKI